jgi:hypothetical protein
MMRLNDRETALKKHSVLVAGRLGVRGEAPLLIDGRRRDAKGKANRECLNGINR